MALALPTTTTTTKKSSDCGSRSMGIRGNHPCGSSPRIILTFRTSSSSTNPPPPPPTVGRAPHRLQEVLTQASPPTPLLPRGDTIEDHEEWAKLMQDKFEEFSEIHQSTKHPEVHSRAHSLSNASRIFTRDRPELERFADAKIKEMQTLAVQLSGAFPFHLKSKDQASALYHLKDNMLWTGTSYKVSPHMDEKLRKIIRTTVGPELRMVSAS